MDYKSKLLKIKESNTILSQFFPDQIYSIKNFDSKITKINSLNKLPNISRENEGKYVSDGYIFFDTKFCVKLLNDYKYKEYCEYLKFHVNNLLILILKDINTNLNSPVDLVKYLFNQNKINYSSFSNFLSIFEVIFLYTESYYKLNSKVNIPNQSIYEKSFVKLKNYSKLNDETYHKMKDLLKIFSDLLDSIDSDKYKLTIKEILKEL
jgi:hypothetical protein